MPVWKPHKGTSSSKSIPLRPEEAQKASKDLDTFLSHFSTDVQNPSSLDDSPYGSTISGSTTVPAKFTPPVMSAAPPGLPGVIGAPANRPYAPPADHFDPEVVKLIEDMGYFGIAPLYRDLTANPQTWQIAVQLKELVKRAAGANREGMEQEGSEPQDTDVSAPIRRRAVIDVEPLPSNTDKNMGNMRGGATSDAVLASLVEKIASHKGALPPLGKDQKIPAHYIGKLIEIKGVSPNIAVFQEFQKAVGTKLAEIAAHNPLNLDREDVEKQVIASNPEKFDVIRRIRNRSSAAFSTYSPKGGRKNKDGDSQYVSELIKGNYHGIECLVDVRDFLTDEARGLVTEDAAATARVLYLVSGPSKGKNAVTASAFRTKDTIGRKPIAIATSLTFESPSKSTISYGNPNLEYPRADSPCFIISYKPQKKSDLFLVESFPLLYTLLRDISVDEVVGYFE